MQYRSWLGWGRIYHLWALSHQTQDPAATTFVLLILFIYLLHMACHKNPSTQYFGYH